MASLSLFVYLLKICLLGFKFSQILVTE